MDNNRNALCVGEQQNVCADVHVHSKYSHDGKSSVAEIIHSAQKKHINVVCITDHCDIYPDYDIDELLRYRKYVMERVAVESHDSEDVQILCGVELGGGFIEPKAAEIIISALPYDMVIGAVHGIMFHGKRTSTARFDFGNADQNTLLEYFEEYLNASVYIAENLDVDVLAHLTYVFRYLNGKYKRNVDWRLYEKTFRRIFRGIIERNIALEINTSSVGTDYDEWFPLKELIDLYIEMGGRRFTLGSDAHRSEKIGQGFEPVKVYLRQKGIDSILYFKDRIPYAYKI